MVIRHRRLGEERLDRLRIMDVVFRGVAGHDPEQEGFGEIDAEDGGVVVRVPIHRLRMDRDVIEAGHGHAFEKVLDVAVAALPRVSVRLFVEAKIFEVEGRLVRSLQLLVLDEMAGEVPGLRRQLRPAEAGFDEAIGGLEILIQQKAGGDEGLPDGVDVFARLLLGEIRRETERVHPAAKEGRERVFVFAVREAAHHGAGGGALDLAARGGDAVAQDADDGEPLVVGGLDLRRGRRHFPEGELIDDVLGRDEGGHVGEGNLEALEFAVALLGPGVVALQAVLVEERRKPFLPERFRGRSEGRGEQEANGEAAQT